MLRYLCFPIKGATSLCGENLVRIISYTNPYLEMKKKHVAISYHKLREYAAARIVNPIKVCSAFNQTEIFTKVVLVGTLVSLSDALYGVDWGDI